MSGTAAPPPPQVVVPTPSISPSATPTVPQQIQQQLQQNQRQYQYQRTNTTAARPHGHRPAMSMSSVPSTAHQAAAYAHNSIADANCSGLTTSSPYISLATTTTTCTTSTSSAASPSPPADYNGPPSPRSPPSSSARTTTPPLAPVEQQQQQQQLQRRLSWSSSSTATTAAAPRCPVCGCFCVSYPPPPSHVHVTLAAAAPPSSASATAACPRSDSPGSSMSTSSRCTSVSFSCPHGHDGAWTGAVGAWGPWAEMATAAAAETSSTVRDDRGVIMHVAAKFYMGLPRARVEAVKGPSRVEYRSEYVNLPMLCARSVSTYPLVTTRPGVQIRDGEPNADSFCAILYENRALIAIADGCNWGERAFKAARNAIDGVMQYIPDRTERVNDLQEIGRKLLRATCEANEKISEQSQNIWDAGTTTLLCCFIIELSDTPPDWAAVIVSVGDCKAFHWNLETKEVSDITSGNRCVDLRDPGGRLGPYIGQGSPDLRNLQLYYHLCKPGDVVMLVTDGIYDNFDPVQLGNTPKDLGIPANDWPDIPRPDLEVAKTKFLSHFINDLYSQHSVSPSEMVNVAVEHAIATTTPAREYMEANPGLKQPTDYKKYPGKMDHTTAIAFQIGPVEMGDVTVGKRVPNSL
ncbi:cyclophilin B [Pelomyxa schiedti]|nr:cyclophilin B [Pelomyxa schiedti]